MKNPDGDPVAVENHITEEVRGAFLAAQDVMEQIRRESFANHVEKLPNLSDAFDLEKHKPAENIHRCICCIILL